VDIPEGGATAGEAKPGSLVLQEKRKLRSVLRRTDLVPFTASAIVSFDLIAYAASAERQVVFWFVGSAIFFLIPYAMISAELGAAFPVEGGPYEWSKMSFGRLPAAITSVIAGFVRGAAPCRRALLVDRREEHQKGRERGSRADGDRGGRDRSLRLPR
jgi:hypothetical protein